MNYLWGVDISHWQDDDDQVYDIDWNKMASEGVQFAIIKATEGKDHVDKYFFDNWDRARLAGIRVAPYHYVRPRYTAEENVENFDRILEQIDLDFGIAIDVEENDGADARKVTSIVQNMLRSYGYKPIMYTADWFSKPNLLPWSGWNDFPLWVMTYPYENPRKRTQFKDFESFLSYLEGGTSFPRIPRATDGEEMWEDWLIWQFTSKGDGKKYGLERGSIDLNIAKPELFDVSDTPPDDNEEPIAVDWPTTVTLQQRLLVADDVIYEGEAVLEKV